MPALLLVHDDPDVLDWLTTLFEANGYEVLIGATAFGARAKLERTEVAAILAGWEVGGGAGRILYDWAKDNRNELLDRFLVLADDVLDEAAAKARFLTALGPTDYSALLEWVGAVETTLGPGRGFSDTDDRDAVVLLVEDDPHQTVLIRDILKGYGFAIETVESATEAIARLERPGIDVVLSDWYLHQGDGAAIYDWLSANQPALLKRCVFISGGSMREVRERAPNATCFPKGQDSRLLVAALTRAARLALAGTS